MSGSSTSVSPIHHSLFTAADHIVNAAKGLTETLKTNKPSNMSTQSNEALTKLAKIFHEAARKYSEKEATGEVPLPGVQRRRQRPTNSTTATPGVPGRTAAHPGVRREPVYRLKNIEVRSITDEAMLQCTQDHPTTCERQEFSSSTVPTPITM